MLRCVCVCGVCCLNVCSLLLSLIAFSAMYHDKIQLFNSQYKKSFDDFQFPFNQIINIGEVIDEGK